MERLFIENNNSEKLDFSKFSIAFSIVDSSLAKQNLSNFWSGASS